MTMSSRCLSLTSDSDSIFFGISFSVSSSSIVSAVKISRYYFKGSSFASFISASLPSADQGPVVQSIVSLTSSLRGQLVKCFTTL